MACPVFVNTMNQTNVKVQEGQLCSKLIKDFLGARVDYMKVKDYLLESSTCSFEKKVTGINKGKDIGKEKYMLPYPLHFNDTSATCMGAPYMGFFPDIYMWN
jgi:hypothetical protein